MKVQFYKKKNKKNEYLEVHIDNSRHVYTRGFVYTHTKDHFFMQALNEDGKFKREKNSTIYPKLNKEYELIENFELDRGDKVQCTERSSLQRLLIQYKELLNANKQDEKAAFAAFMQYYHENENTIPFETVTGRKKILDVYTVEKFIYDKEKELQM
ncbi:hypothetical protein KTQ89_07140 [Holdemanella porci]|uniref:hypothetical protein n=1 Tax=Holdemanella porci TaxID=2652276 RepID=UPI001C2BCD60|nr:hypothetical protein [Holdemanella porci]MBU9872128.1 hypothetical protein [Holdemanella porci]